MIGAWILFVISLTVLAITLSRNSVWLKQWKAKRKSKQLERAVKTVESYGFTVAEINTSAGTDYIRASDGSWRKIGGKK